MNKITDLTKTIVALATALGSGSIAIVRISGQRAIEYTNSIFTGTDLAGAERNTIHFGKIVFQGQEIDQVLISLFKKPHSYTGEDVVEISCHANPYIVKDIIDALISQGASHAGPGEFTMRAFLNGKMDLSQAEAVSDIIAAKTQKGLQNSIGQLEGLLTGYLASIKQSLINILGLLEIDLDFAEEGIEVAPPGELSKQLSGIEAKLNQLAASFNYGKLFNSTLNMAIVGQPNVGKSSLLNAFVGEERAITSHTPGTTRDTLHENVLIGNIFFKLIDTAGLRQTNDTVELMGIERTKKQITSANIVLYVIDGSKDITESGFLFKDPIVQDSRSRTIVVINKSDLGIRRDVRAAVKKEKLTSICVSAKNGDGISDLNNEIVALVSRGYESFGDELVITNARHRDLLDKSVRYIARARAVIEDNAGFELAAVDLRDALNTMGEISGETATDDILNQVFANFCIGK